jgi:hypothetical protein
VFYARFLYNLKKRKTPEYIIRWTESFFKDKILSLTFDGQISEVRSIITGIPQRSPILFILFLFFNADLVEICDKMGVTAISIGFVNDINILTYGKTTERNYQILSGVHAECERWARKHGAIFALKKYELMHLTRTLRKFNIAVNITVESRTITFKEHIRILGIQINTKLR